MQTNMADFYQFVVAFVAVLFLGIDNGVVAAVFFSIGMLVYKSFNPRIRVLGHLPDRPDLFVDARRFPGVVQVPSVKVVRVDSAIHFGNVKRITTKLRVRSTQYTHRRCYGVCLDGLLLPGVGCRTSWRRPWKGIQM